MGGNAFSVRLGRQIFLWGRKTWWGRLELRGFSSMVHKEMCVPFSSFPLKSAYSLFLSSAEALPHNLFMVHEKQKNESHSGVGKMKIDWLLCALQQGCPQCIQVSGKLAVAHLEATNGTGWRTAM